MVSKGNLLASCSPVIKIKAYEAQEATPKSTGAPPQLNFDLRHLNKEEASKARLSPAKDQHRRCPTCSTGTQEASLSKTRTSGKMMKVMKEQGIIEE